MTQLKTIVILAAGNGTRFGGAKQFACFGTQAKTLMEYNLIHALAAGFNHVVFITQAQQKQLLEQEVISRLPKSLTVDIAIQALTSLPEKCSIPTTRTKPLGTAHALWCAKEFINNPFVVINADDYYGKKAFSLLQQHQAIDAKSQLPQYAMVAYLVQKTLSQHGGVNRGLCKFNQEMQLTKITEIENIHIKSGHNNLVISGQDSIKNQSIDLPENSLVSMNLWAFDSSIFSAIEQELIKTLTATSTENIECYLPNVVMSQLNQQQVSVNVLTSDDDWFGVTYAADATWVNHKIDQLFSSPISSYKQIKCYL